jgi:hypothetical protein
VQCRPKDRPPQVSAIEHGPLDVRVLQVCAPQVCTREISSLQKGMPEVGIHEECVGGIHAL